MRIGMYFGIVIGFVIMSVGSASAQQAAYPPGRSPAPPGYYWCWPDRSAWTTTTVAAHNGQIPGHCAGSPGNYGGVVTGGVAGVGVSASAGVTVSTGASVTVGGQPGKTGGCPEGFLPLMKDGKITACNQHTEDPTFLRQAAFGVSSAQYCTGHPSGYKFQLQIPDGKGGVRTNYYACP